MTIGEWLHQLGLGQYIAAFEENAVDFDVLPQLTGDDLKEIGVAAVGHRRRLIDAIAALRDAPSPSAPAPVAAEPAGERRQVSVLFADLVGYSALSSELDPEDVHGLLDAYFELADRAIIDHGGAVDKHIGDCVMGVFGAPVAHGNDAERAVRAAVAIRDGAPGRLNVAGREIGVHIGVASGEVVAAAGGQAHRQYTVTGESVNLASRLADKAQPGEILISDAVRSAVAHRFACEAAGEFGLKGFAGPLTAWRVGTACETILRDTRPFVGRAAEIRQLGAALEGSLSARVGQTIHIRGEPGIGKSRLVEEFARLARGAGHAVLQGLVLDFGGDNGRAAIAALCRGMIGRTAGAGGAPADSRLEDAIAGAGLDPAATPIVYELLNATVPQEVRPLFDAMDNAARSRHARQAIKRLVGSACRYAPLLLIVEDVHWADMATLDLVSAIGETVGEQPAILAVTSRVDGDPTTRGWIPPGPVLTLDLAPLGRKDAMALAANYVDAATAQVEACVERAAGNPLFLDQLLQLVEARVEDAVPDSVQSLVQARMDQLPARDKQALQTASVLGQTFSIDALRHLLGDPSYEGDLLTRRHLLRQEDDGFIFCHALIRDAAYGTLLRERRRDLHRRAAGWLGGRDQALAAEHLAMAEDPGAPSACLDAAASLVARYRYEQALSLIDKGLAQARASDESVSLQLLRGETLLLSGAAEQARQAFAKAIEAATTAHDRSRAWLGLASAKRIVDDIESALADVDRALDAAQRDGLVEKAARSHALRGNLLFPLGDIEGCCRAHERSLALARQAGSAELEAAALGGLGDAEYMRGRLATAFARFSECVVMAGEHGLRRIEAANLPMKAITQLWIGDARISRALALDAIDRAGRIGHERAQIIAHHAAYWACRHLLMRDEAAHHVEHAIGLARRLRAARFEAEGLAFRGQIAADGGDVGAARADFHEALAISRRHGMAYIGPAILGGCAATAQTDAEFAAAVAEAEALLAAGSASHNHLIFRRDMIDLCLQRGDWSAAGRHADAVAAYAAAEPTAIVDFVVDRARALIAHGKGETNAGDELDELARRADALGDLQALVAIEDALRDGRSEA